MAEGRGQRVRNSERRSVKARQGADLQQRELASLDDTEEDVTGSNTFEFCHHNRLYLALRRIDGASEATQVRVVCDVLDVMVPPHLVTELVRSFVPVGTDDWSRSLIAGIRQRIKLVTAAWVVRNLKASVTARTGPLWPVIAEFTEKKQLRFFFSEAACRFRVLAHRRAMKAPEVGPDVDLAEVLRAFHSQVAELRNRPDSKFQGPRPAHTALGEFTGAVGEPRRTLEVENGSLRSTGQKAGVEPPTLRLRLRRQCGHGDRP